MLRQIMNSDLIKNAKGPFVDLAMRYHRVLSTFLDLHAPLITKSIYPKLPNPWISPDILASKRQRRYLERVWRKSPTALNRSRLTRQTHLCNRLMTKAKSHTFPKSLLTIQVTIDPYGRPSTNSFTVVPQCAPARPLFCCCISGCFWIFLH